MCLYFDGVEFKNLALFWAVLAWSESWFMACGAQLETEYPFKQVLTNGQIGENAKIIEKRSISLAQSSLDSLIFRL